MPDPSSLFYIGRLYDAQQGKVTDQPLSYDPADLTTHAIVTGMTGSGKTGLCIAMLEEAALQGIPALIIDPKGDLTNLLLHFPDLAPASFQPWLDPEQMRRQNRPAEEIAAETAAYWKKGLEEWGIGPERITALQNKVHFAVYTPGSDAGLPLSILSSLKSPGIPWEGNREVLREMISTTVTALLSLVGLQDVDPVRSREHILLSNIFENAWSQGKDLDLTELILQTQTPPITKLGVFPLENFFPEKDRTSLAMLLNNFLAAPSFQTWMEGQPLDIPSFLQAADGKPQHTIFYLSHLSDPERMFFVTLLFSAVQTWMRTQPGTSALRALLYFDEIVGYLPPIGNPPSKALILEMLKQARAFGVGLILASQNPVDVDYKGLSNAGTWFIGTLQTDQDKQRLLDGLESAGSLDRAEYDRLISGLRKRIFLMRNVHDAHPVVFQTRWTMNYLAGPLTRAQIPALLRLLPTVSAAPTASDTASAPAAAETLEPLPVAPAAQVVSPAGAVSPIGGVPPLRGVPPNGDKSSQGDVSPQEGASPFGDSSATRPAVPGSAAEYYLPNDLTLSEAVQALNMTLTPGYQNQGLIYRPALVGQVQVRYLQRKYNLDTVNRRTVLVTAPDRRGMVRWEDFSYPAFDPQRLEQSPLPDTRFGSLETPLSDGKMLANLQKDFMDWAYRTSQIHLRGNDSLQVYTGPEVSKAQFIDRCSEVAHQGREEETAKVTAAYTQKIAALKDKIAHQQRQLSASEDEVTQRRTEEIGTGVENVLGLFTHSRRRLSTSLTKHRLTEQAKARVEESQKEIQGYQADLAELEKSQAQAVQEVSNRWAALVSQETDIPIVAQKKDVFQELFGVAWLPYYVLLVDQKVVEIPGFSRGNSA